jgi:hypothetical protein
VGNFNSFFGTNAGLANTTGISNTFLGRAAGLSNTMGSNDIFVGAGAGSSNITGVENVFVGNSAGSFSTADNNAFFGHQSGLANTAGSGNSFFGSNTGNFNTTGSNNTAVGFRAEVGGGGNLDHATAIGAHAFVSTSHTVVLGTSSETVQVPGRLAFTGIGLAGAQALCRNASFEISNCSSSLRYKTNIAPFSAGLKLINRLRPISFTWKEGGMKDLGLGAEDVEKVEPLFGDEHTHTSRTGAELNAECVISGLKALKTNPLAAAFSPKAKAVAPYEPLRQQTRKAPERVSEIGAAL